MSAAASLEEYRPALTGHCYRMLGSVVDAEDAVQESMLRAWKGIDHFAGQSSLKTWLYRIATSPEFDSAERAIRTQSRSDAGRNLRRAAGNGRPLCGCLRALRHRGAHRVAARGGDTPAFAQYRDGGTTPWAVLMLERRGDRVSSMTSYLDVETLFPRFGLPMVLSA